MSSLFWDLAGEAIAPGHAGSPADEVTARIDRLQAERAERTVLGFRQRMDRLTLICMAMWSLLREKAGLTEEDLLERVRQIDLADGKEDGKAAKQVARCPKCGRTMSPRHGRCLYCGAEDLEHTVFDAVR